MNPPDEAVRAERRVLVTGASRGIGFSIAKMFLDAGARVAIHGSSEESVGAAMERLAEYEHKVAAPGDLATVAGCESAVKTAIEVFGGLDVLVNNAGVGAGLRQQPQRWERHGDH